MRSLLSALPLVVVALAPFLVPLSSSAAQLPEKWRVWLDEEVYPLITFEQRKAFLALETEEQRNEFTERLWEEWSAQHDLGRAFRRVYEDRLESCRTEFNSTIEDRARLLLIHGNPGLRKEVSCDRVFNPLEIWMWAYLPGLGQNVTVIFFQPYGLGRFRLWDPTIDTRAALYNTQGTMALNAWRSGPDSIYQLARPEYTCGGDGDDILRLISMAELWGRDISARKAFERYIWEGGGPQGSESVSQRFLDYSTVVPKDSEPVEFDLQAEVGTRRGGKLSVSFSGTLPRSGLTTNKIGDTEVVQLDVVGEIAREGHIDDRFRYSFTFPATSTELPIVVQRELRPGKYNLRLKIQDANSKHAGVKELEFAVAEPATTAPTEQELAADATVARIAQTAGLPVLSLQGPDGEGVTGVQRFTAMVGPKVTRVEFLLNGKTILTKNRAPFEVELDLGAVPRLASIVAVAYGADGTELERRQIDVNVGRERFFVRLQPVSASDRKASKVRAQASVNVPSDRKLAKLELYWNEALTATLYKPPFDLWLSVTDDGSIGYLRALATLEDGGQAEDIRFVNAPEFLTGVQVQTVELAVTVLGDDGKPVDGLAQQDFEVLEDSRPQRVTFFSRQQEMPVRLGIVIDTSGSMDKTLPEVQRVVLGFLRNLLRPVDRACVVAFADRPALLESFTADFQSLERALIALRADRGTALYDATAFGLFQFSGVRGRKAMIVLTDGEDNASRLSADRALDYAQRSGVTVYTIGVDLSIAKIMARSHLSKLARASGGEAFFLARGGSLEPVYETINRELRSQYLLTYTSDSEKPEEQFRKITVRVTKPGLEVRHMAGYYPGG